MFVIYEERIVIPDQINRNIPTRKSQNLKLIKLAEELFEYSKRLVVIYEEWNKEYFPNPEYFDENTEEGWYIVRTNDLFVEVVNFILYHEIAHAELEHLDQIKEQKLNDESRKQLEFEADTRAVELMLEKNRNINIAKLAIIIGLASMLFCKQHLNGGKKHPNIDKRIENVLNLINPEDDSYLWSFLVLFMKLWDKQFNHNFTYETEYSTYKGLYYDLIKQAK